MLKKTAKITLLTYLINLFFPMYAVFAINSLPLLNQRNVCSNGQYEVVMIKSDGIINSVGCYTTHAEAQLVMNSQNSTELNVASILFYDVHRTLIDAKYGMLDLKTKPNSSFTTNLNPVLAPSYASNYINGYSAPDAPMLGYHEYKDSTYTYTTARLKISGYDGWIRKFDTAGYKNYNVIPLSLITNATYYYVNTNGELIHRITKSIMEQEGYMTSINLGPAPKFLEQGRNYYSYEGNYFYHDLMTMIDDYKLDTYAESINADSPYYNYYQYLPYRTKSAYIAEDIDYYFTAVKGYTAKPAAGTPTTGLPGNLSMLYNEGANFINAQNKFGANAMLTYGIAINESGWGRSPIAINKNNLFGHSAYDYAPGESASGYISVAASIYYHSDRYISASYSRPGGTNYYGSHLGNKGSGMNVKYASDPYWGEKAAQLYYAFDKVNGLTDYELHKIGIKNTNSSAEPIRVRKEATTGSSILYEMKGSSWGTSNMPVAILETVEGETINGNNVWYKVQSDAVLDQNRVAVSLPPNNHTYDWDSSYGYIHSSLIRLTKSTNINIVANSKSIPQGSVFDPLEGVIAYDAEDNYLTDSITIVRNDVNTALTGEYLVTYRVISTAGEEATKTITITVKSNTAPVINASDITVLQNVPFNPLTGVSAIDAEDGNITSKIKVTNNVNITEAGTYTIVYSVTDTDYNVVEKTIIVTVKVNSSPVINANPISINQGEDIDLLQNVTAGDNEDGPITHLINTTGYINNKMPGIYPVVYSVTDSDGNRTNKMILVTVNGEYQEVGGNFYLHSLDWSSNNTIDVSGYLTVNGINNIHSQNIVYEFILKSVDSSEIYSLPLERWNFSNAYPFKVPSENGFNYADSWFKGSLDLTNIPEGDYDINIKARMNGRETTAVLRNAFSRNITRKATDDNGRGYLFRTNYYLKTMPIELFIRDKGLLSSAVPPTSFDNMFNSYRRLELIKTSDQALLDIRGISFNVMGDYSRNVDVIREIVFEDTKTFEQYTKILGYVDNANTGANQITLKVPDGKDKTRAWFDNQLDLSDLPIGSYAIYIRTKAGSADDYGELTDISFRNLNKSIILNEKSYSLILNAEKRGRIELVVNSN